MTASTHPVEALVELVAELLPAQGPIGIFIHHNTLHAFEDRPFEDAVLEAGRLFGCEPFLSEQAYRAEISRGRITEAELRETIDRDLGERRAEPVADLTSRAQLAYLLACHGLPDARGTVLRWLLEEGDALERLRDDVPLESRFTFAAIRGDADGGEREQAWLRELWAECLAAVGRAQPRPEPHARRGPRHRDLLLQARGVDLDAAVHPPLIRFTAAYLDQGQALWPMQGRDRGMLGAFVDCYRHPFVRHCAQFGPQLVALLEREAAAQRAAADSIAASLDALGVHREERFRFLLETALALRGWAGMVRQIEERPDRVPVQPVPARLADFLAVRLLVERAALEHALPGVPLERCRAVLEPELPRPTPPSAAERAWPLFQVAQLLGLEPLRVSQLGSAAVEELEAAIAAFPAHDRRRVLHLAFELHLRRRFFDALVHHAPHEREEPWLQTVCCIDEREESIRRHLEEADTWVETFGTAGFFAVPMYFKGERDARARPQAPVAIRPRHYVELERPEGEEADSLIDRLSRARGQALHVGSRGLFRALLLTLLGAVSLVPLVLRVLFPRYRRAGPASDRRAHDGALALHRREGPAPLGDHRGFTHAEMAETVDRVLSDVGLWAQGFAPVVLVFGHASDSLNNPHRSAYDCGACGGGPGGPNARAFVTMANDPAVRALLQQRGRVIPEGTWFIGAEHNTTDDAFVLYDVKQVPQAIRPLVERVREVLDEARGRNAQERCRRFANLPSLSPQAALRHVEGRRQDLGEPRPEYNHATNAVCVVGRRARTRGLFLDRRAFLVSYDPLADDDEGTVLARTLAAALPVLVGINLEYFFGTVDNEGYGSGTKLPHNVASLVGVMNGAQSDLRTGLWAQTVEIHEPVRLTVAVEVAPDKLERVIAKNAYLEQLVARRWVFVAALDPHGASLWELEPPGRRLHAPGAAPPTVRAPSRNWFHGKGGHLPFAKLVREG